ncbi:MAG: ATP-binding protein [Candidatus Bathyarchaeota archaeon]|nr:ATP-binding protein [Candidatus Bathyarchaeota archaeon]
MLCQKMIDGAKKVHLVYLDRDFNFVRVNRAYARTCGFEPSEMIGKNHFSLYPHEENEAIFKRVRDTGIAEEFHDKPFVFPDQPERGVTYWDWTLEPVKNKCGEVEGLVFSLVETTERKKAQEALKILNEELESRINQRTNELALERERLFSMLESLPVMVSLITSNYRIAFANRLFRETFGESKGRPCYEYVSGKRSPCNYCESLEPLETGKPHHWIANLENGMVIDTYDYPFIDVDGTRMVLEVNIDITEQKKLEKKLQEKDRLAAIGATAGMVGHDIRNPLQAMLSDIYLLREYLKNMPDMPIKKEVAESLEGIENNIGYINKIVADLQDYARPLNPEFSDVNLADVITTIFKNIELPDNIKLSIDLKTLPTIRTDPTFIKRSLTNLVNNAIQAMPNGGNLEITAYMQNDNIFITVSDTGIGIPEEVKPKLFTPMVTTKSKGQGLGLAVVKRLVEVLNGSITFESREGKGTKFSINIPIIPDTQKSG